MKKSLLLGAALALATITNAQVELLTNGSFESGALAPWTVDSVNGTDSAPGSCVENWRVQADSFDVCGFVIDFLPTDGVFGAFTSFDTDVADTEWILEQTVTLPATIVAADFSFDFIAEFDFTLGGVITIPRELRIDITQTDGTPVSNFWLDQFIDPVGVSVNYSQSIDVSSLLSGLEGGDAIIRITALIPEVATGPSKAMIDNVSFIVDDGLNVEDFTLANALRVSPNPSNGTFTLNYEGLEALQSAAIYDMTGKRLAQFNLEAGLVQQTLTANLPTGMYLLRVDSQSSSTTKKLLIQ